MVHRFSISAISPTTTIANVVYTSLSNTLTRRPSYQRPVFSKQVILTSNLNVLSLKAPNHFIVYLLRQEPDRFESVQGKESTG